MPTSVYPSVPHVLSTDRRVWVNAATVTLNDPTRHATTSALFLVSPIEIQNSRWSGLLENRVEDVRVIMFDYPTSRKDPEQGTVAQISGWLLERKKFAGARRQISLFTSTRYVRMSTEAPKVLWDLGILPCIIRGQITLRWSTPNMVRWLIKPQEGNEEWFICATYRSTDTTEIKRLLDAFNLGSTGVFVGHYNDPSCPVLVEQGVTIKVIELALLPGMMDVDYAVGGTTTNTEPERSAGPSRPEAVKRKKEQPEERRDTKKQKVSAEKPGTTPARKNPVQSATAKKPSTVLPPTPKGKEKENTGPRQETILIGSDAEDSGSSAESVRLRGPREPKKPNPVKIEEVTEEEVAEDGAQ